MKSPNKELSPNPDLVGEHFGVFCKELRPLKARSFFYTDSFWKVCRRVFAKLRVHVRRPQRVISVERPHVGSPTVKKKLKRRYAIKQHPLINRRN